MAIAMESTDRVQASGIRRRTPAPDNRARNREVVVGLVCAVAFAVFGMLAQQIKTSGLAGTGIGPSFFPTVLAVIGTGLSLVFCVVVLVWRPGDDPDAVPPSADDKTPSALRPAVVLAAPLAWALALPVLGYLVSTWAILTSMILLFDGRRGTAWLVVPIIVTGVLWLAFAAVLKVDLPVLRVP